MLDTNRPALSDFLIGATSGRPAVVVGYPVPGPAGQVGGVLGIAIDLVALGRVFAIVPLPQGSVITVTDREGRILARTLEAEKYVGRLVRSNAADPSRVPRGGSRRRRGSAADLRQRPDRARAVALSVRFRARGVRPRPAAVGAHGAIGIAFLFVTFLFTFLITLAVSRLLAQLTKSARPAPPTATCRRRRTPTPVQPRRDPALRRVRGDGGQPPRGARTRSTGASRRSGACARCCSRSSARSSARSGTAAVGLLVSGVAHELNNPLQAILGTAELLERVPDLGAEALREVAFLKTQSGRAREIIRNLSRFSSQQSGPTELIDLRDVVGEVMQLRRRDLETANISLDVELSSTRRVYANFTEIEQVTLNFVINAQQSIEAVGKTCGRVLIRVFDLGKRVRLEVQDDGAGVKPEDEPKLFQPFFTTKPVGKGTGLGLSVSYGIIDSHGGSIGYRNNDWGGATFYFELPAAAASSSQTHDRSPLLHRSV